MGKTRKTIRARSRMTYAKLTEEQQRSRRKVIAKATNYGQVVTVKHATECAVFASGVCCCEPVIRRSRGGIARRSKKRAAQYRAMRKRVILRDGGRCRYCGVIPDVIEVDHVVPWSRGGRDDMDNLVTACRPCNQDKFDAMDWEPIPLDEMPTDQEELEDE